MLNHGAVARIAFVTSADWPHLTEDDLLGARALAKKGVTIEAAIWSRMEEWHSFDLIVLRSCWDYHHSAAAFRTWVAEAEQQRLPLVNAASTVRWNLNKRYLVELREAGARVIDSAYIATAGTDLDTVMALHEWKQAVLKPAVSADGHRTVLVERAHAHQHQQQLDALAVGGGALVQQFVPEIRSEGELSFIFLGGEFSHGVRKRPANGDFRVQARFGGSVEPLQGEAPLVDQAWSVLELVEQPWTYARVDGCLVNGRLQLMELELIEPSLFLAFGAGAADNFARALLRLLR